LAPSVSSLSSQDTPTPEIYTLSLHDALPISEHDGIPLGLYARASLAEALAREADELFEVTAAALDHYHQLFGIRYPWGKYDQVRSEEHTSELQSRENLVCRLLLEKKKANRSE